MLDIITLFVRYHIIYNSVLYYLSFSSLPYHLSFCSLLSLLDSLSVRCHISFCSLLSLSVFAIKDGGRHADRNARSRLLLTDDAASRDRQVGHCCPERSHRVTPHASLTALCVTENKAITGSTRSHKHTVRTAGAQSIPPPPTPTHHTQTFYMPELSKLLSLKSGLGQNITTYASSAARNCACFQSALSFI